MFPRDNTVHEHNVSLQMEVIGQGIRPGDLNAQGVIAIKDILVDLHHTGINVLRINAMPVSAIASLPSIVVADISIDLGVEPLDIQPDAPADRVVNNEIDQFDS